MEVLLGLACIIFAIAFLFDKATDFLKQLKQSGSAKLSKGFTAQLSVVPINKKSEECALTHLHPNDNGE